MTDTARTNERERPISSPINTSVVDGAITDVERAAHILVSGDTGLGKQLRVRHLAEGSLSDKRQLIYFSRNSACFGLRSAFPELLRFGRRAHAVEIQPDDGALFAACAVKSGKSMAFDFSEMSHDDVSRFLSDFMGVINTTPMAGMDISFECLDDLVGRKRHRDKNTVNTFKSMLLSGILANGGNDVRVVAGITSPEEVPIETGRHSLTLIATCTSAPPNVNALSGYVQGDVHISRYQHVAPWGIRYIKDHQQWLWSFSNRSLMHMPHYLELPDLISDAGGPKPSGIETSDDEQVALDAILELRAEREADKPEPSTTSRAFRTASSRHCPVGSASRHRATPNLAHRVDIARVCLNLSANGTLVHRGAVNQTALNDAIHAPSYDVPASWVSKTWKLKTLAGLVSVPLAGYAYHVALSENHAKAKAFFENLMARPTEGCTADLAQALSQLGDAPMRSQERLDAVLAAWRSYANPARIKCAANDDAVVREAV